MGGILVWGMLVASTAATGTGTTVNAAFLTHHVAGPAESPGNASPPGPLLITEIMFRPRTGEPEWVELLNTGSLPLEVREWSLADSRGCPRPVRPEGAALAPRCYALVTEDPPALRRLFALPSGVPVFGLRGSWPRLNNGTPGDSDPADAVVVRSTGGFIDSVSYWSSWAPAKGQSVERADLSRPSTDPLAWAPSPPGGEPSPGRPARGGPGRGESSGLTCEPNPFDPGREHTLLCLSVPRAGGIRGRLFIFDLGGRLVRALWQGQLPTGRMCIEWEGRDDRGSSLPRGAYIVLFEGGDPTTGELWVDRHRLVIAR